MIKIKNAVEVKIFSLHLLEDIFRYDGALLLATYQKENGEKFIESWCDHEVDELSGLKKYLYYKVPLSDEDLKKYLNHEITLKALIEKSEYIIFEEILEDDFSSSSTFLKIIAQDFPEDYMPLEDSFCLK